MTQISILAAEWPSMGKKADADINGTVRVSKHSNSAVKKVFIGLTETNSRHFRSKTKPCVEL